jgi:predicted AlkP superfamily pyrophosphatase or phosphodiesterase
MRRDSFGRGPRRRGLVGIAAVALAVAASLTLGLLATPKDSERAPPPAQSEFLRVACRMPAEWARYLYRGWQPGKQRAWDLALVPEPGSWFGTRLATSHSGPYAFLQRIPLVFFGDAFIKPAGPLHIGREITLADVAPTFARLMQMPFDRSGTPITEVLKRTPRVPRLVVTIVIDGGGWNVLEQWPRAWPALAGLMRKGASVQDAVVGSSPSITPAVHSTLSTGHFPRRHGVMAIVARADTGALVSGFASKPFAAAPQDADPTVTLDSTTLADEWDLDNDNRARVAMIASQAFHAGMLGHGSSLRGADKDIAAMTLLDEIAWATNPEFYRLPGYVNQSVGKPNDHLAAVDRADGEADGKWRGHDYWRVDATPAYAYWQNEVARTILDHEGFGDDRITDLLYINYKAPDAAGHRWNMLSIEQRDVLTSVDSAIQELVRTLNARVGERNYAAIVTADHGQTPLAFERGLPVGHTELRQDIERAFDDRDNGIPVVERVSTALYFMNREEMQRNDVTPEEIASYISGYSVRDNVPSGKPLPRGYAGRAHDALFAAAVPGRRLDDLVRCTRAFDQQ